MSRGIILFAAVTASWTFLTIQGGVSAQGTDGGTTPLDQISDFAMWAAIAGFVGTWLVAILNRHAWPSTLKFAVFFAWSCLAAAIDAYLKRELDFDNWVRALLIVFFVGQGTYLAGKSAIKEVEAKTG